jgi:hypothetical protein
LTPAEYAYNSAPLEEIAQFASRQNCVENV